jgi:hypothetical protein
MAKREIGARSYRLYAALHEDIAEGFVWLKQADLPARSVVKIARSGSGRTPSVFCEALQFEKNFLTRYNNHTERICKINGEDEASALVINHWYRTKLGKPGQPLETKNDYRLEITPANSLRGRLCACLQHPQVVVRVATLLGLIAFAMGLVGVVLGMVSICKTANLNEASSSAPLPRQSDEQRSIPGRDFQSVKTIADIAKLSFVNERCRLWGPDGDIDVDQTCLIVKTANGGLVVIPNEYSDQELQEITAQLGSKATDRDRWLKRFYEIGGGEKSQK